MTIKSGVLIPLLIMLPNVVWMLWPKAGAGQHVSAPRLLTMVENVGRVAVLILPLFFSLDLSKERSTPVMIGMGLALTVYYVSGCDWEVKLELENARDGVTCGGRSPRKNGASVISWLNLGQDPIANPQSNPQPDETAARP